MSKLIKICVNGHEYKGDNNMFNCPKCGEKLNFRLVNKERKKRIEANEVISNFRDGKVSFSELNSSLPRMPWFGEIKDNYIGSRAGERWSWDELEMLEEFFNNYGVSDSNVWKDIAESIFDRSIYSIEHMVRIFNNGIKLEEIHF